MIANNDMSNIEQSLPRVDLPNIQFWRYTNKAQVDSIVIIGSAVYAALNAILGQLGLMNRKTLVVATTPCTAEGNEATHTHVDVFIKAKNDSAIDESEMIQHELIKLGATNSAFLCKRNYSF